MPRKLQLDIRLLRRECVREAPLARIAALFGCSLVTVKRHIRKHVPAKLRRKAWQRSPSNPLNKRLVKLYTNDHLSTEEAGNRLGWSAEKVRKRLILLGVNRRKHFVDLRKFPPGTFSSSSRCSETDAGLLNSEIMRLYSESLSQALVASEVGVDVGTVRRRLAFMGVPIRRWSYSNKGRDEEIRELYLCGKSSYSLARSFGISGSQVLRVLEKLGVPRKRSVKDYGEDSVLCSRIRRLHLDDGKSVSEIAVELGICWKKVRMHLAASGAALVRHNNFQKQEEFNSQVKMLYLGGLRMREVAERLGCCVAKVQKRLRYLGLKVRNASQYYTPDEVRRNKRIVYWKRKRLGVAAIAKMEGLPCSTVYYVLVRNGVRMDKRDRMNANQRGILQMALLNPQKYRDFADRMVAKREARARPKWLEDVETVQNT